MTTEIQKQKSPDMTAKEQAQAVLDKVITEEIQGKHYGMDGGLDKEIYEADNRLQKTDIPRRAQVETLIDRIRQRQANGDCGEPSEAGPGAGLDSMRSDLNKIQECANRLVTVWIANRCLALNCPGDAGQIALALQEMEEEIERRIAEIKKALEQKEQAWTSQ